ncbi:FHA domain-containing protein [uncultured Actinomyces sp.]|uniref:FHA domain-containing protein n=1 Tax=uncultured Actinomyces sp. TaxID=249061 RepID=UPI00267167CD|nr:FHA domain-containing protein [uncultured Actinomyces sp.]
MRRRTWTPGGYPAAVTERGIFVLEPVHEALAQRFWELMVDGADLPVLLQELTSAFAANLASLPSFVAIIDEAGGAHIAVRGAFEVVVDGPEGPTSVAGGNVITWSEYRFRTHSGWRIATPVDGPMPEAPQWQVLSAVLPVCTLASGTVGEVGSAGASPIVSRVESEACPGLDEAAVPAPSATPIDEAAVPAPSATPIDEAGPATSAPVHLPETEEDAHPLALASQASSQGEPADEALMVVEDDDSPAAAFFAAAAAPFFEEEPLGSEVPAPLADDESDEPDDPPSAPLHDCAAPAAEALAQAESTGEETQIPWYDREEEAEESSPDDDRVSSGDAQPDPEPEEEQALSPAIDAEPGYVPGEQGSEDRVSPYEYLYDDVTRAGTVEDAAVRHVRNSDVIDDDPVPVPPPHGPFTGNVQEADQEPAPAPSLPISSVPLPATPAQPEPPLDVPPGGFFIDSVPGVSSDAHSTPTAKPSATYRRFMEATADGDHDGMTTLPQRARELRDYARHVNSEPDESSQSASVQVSPSAQASPAAVGPQVLAVLCEQGHPNATHASSCRVCSSPLGSTAVTVPRPSLGRIVLSTGEEVALEQDIIIGRRPRSSAGAGRQPARLVIVPSPRKQISRSHCELRIDDWDVRLHDLGSNNGTYLTRPGQAPVRLDENVPTVLKPGDVVELGEEISFRMEE